MSVLITIFTPTYNRAYILPVLYSSLLHQTFTDFEWLIVDDGSSDDTESLIKGFSNEDKINITYIKQENGGKHRAINRGLREARGKLFFIVDSDDFLPSESLEILAHRYKEIEDSTSTIGISGQRFYSNGKVIGSMYHEDLVCTNFEYRYKYKIEGDKAEIFKTEILRNYSFPEIEGENFIAEGSVWSKLAQDGFTLLHIKDNVYVTEYLPDGLSAKSYKLRRDNPKGSSLLYADLAHYNVPLIIKLKSTINYWRFARFDKTKTVQSKMKVIGFFKTLLVCPIIFFYYLKDLKK